MKLDMHGRFDAVDFSPAKFILIFAPGYVGNVRWFFDHRDAVSNRAYQGTHVASDAGILFDFENIHASTAGAGDNFSSAAYESSIRMTVVFSVAV